MGDQNVEGLLTGLANGLNQYMGTAIAGQQKQKEKAYESQLDTQKAKDVEQYKSGLELSNDQAKQLYKQVLDGVIDPETAGKISPKHAAVIQGWMDANGGRKPPTGVADKLFDDIKTESDKTQKSDDVRLTQWARTLSSDREFTLSRTKRDSLENVGALLDQVKTQPDGPDSRQLYEQAVAQMRVLANNGQISEKEIDQLLPKTLRGNMAQKLEWLTNHPVGTEAQDFLKRSTDFFHRESKVTNDQMSRRFKDLAAPYSSILSRNKGPASETYAQYGVEHPDYNPSTKKGNDPLNLGI